MRNTNRVLTLLAAVVIAGCSTLSQDIASDGGGAGEIVFPAVASATLDGGTVVNLDNLRQVAPGMSKDQLYDLLGRPHFHEGAFGAREWDYLFNMPIGADGDIVVCQYKVLFDETLHAGSFHWKPATCGDRLVSSGAPVPAPPQAPAESLSLSTETLFAFDSATLRPEASSMLDDAARQLKAATPGHVRVSGHSDRIGDDAYNLALSRARAAAVRDYLMAHGVPADVIEAEGHGEQHPVAHCHDASDRGALIACLAPNRRVEIHWELQERR